MNLITKKKFINAVKEVKEIYFVGCVNSSKYTLEQLKKIIDGATHEQLTADKRRVIKVNNYQMISIKGGERNYLQFKPFVKYYQDNNVYYIVEENAILIYYIDKE